jgi:hypothetical protein
MILNFACCGPLVIRRMTAHRVVIAAAALAVFTGQAANGSAELRSRIAAAMTGIPFSFHEALWSDPLGLVPGGLPASPPNAGRATRRCWRQPH